MFFYQILQLDAVILVLIITFIQCEMEFSQTATVANILLTSTQENLVTLSDVVFLVHCANSLYYHHSGLQSPMFLLLTNIRLWFSRSVDHGAGRSLM
jgi:hypothetical protein